MPCCVALVCLFVLLLPSAQLHQLRLHEYPTPTACVSSKLFYFSAVAPPEAAECLGSITVITARPRGFGGIVKGMTQRDARHLGLPHASVMNGSVMKLTSIAAIVSQKLKNFQQVCVRGSAAEVFVWFGLVFAGLRICACFFTVHTDSPAVATVLPHNGLEL